MTDEESPLWQDTYLYNLYYKVKTKQIPHDILSENIIKRLNEFILDYFIKIQNYNEEQLSGERFKKHYLI